MDAKNLFYSKRISQIEEYANPSEDKNQFFQDLIKICNEHNIDAIFPTGTTATNYLSYFKKDLQEHVKTSILVENYETFSQLTDKWETYKLCKKIGIPVPKTILFTNTPETLEEIKQLTFPIIAKPRISYASYGVLFFNSIDEFKASIDKLTGYIDPGSDIHEPYIIQEVIQGTLHDVALCAYQGNPAMMLSQQRVMTLRDFGGGGIINLTTHEPEMMGYAKNLIRELQWNGPALFDFIKTAKNEYYLLEINPKIWGTTRLIVEAGMNLPQTMIDLFVLNKSFNEKTDYEKTCYINGCFQNALLLGFYNHLP
ncbi:carbamoylphosphate synthase large subunit [Legionella oakridgensis ATCC 33761 = DSM 21215]|uniref:Carbamoylphosphate synthase large subunit n=1 Tax=Legionella oakridgensis ATCC 33761 = DSM 21215 TaxID=1268635 RepID=W0BG98_9GAMM|nr:ATP-grasp domain-containing protein [Legionella oakridgensis]AHE67647.1 carbamoylphosphate synthase large subunit [Legionella oakridgensis ATCC 33761 = DSM 21215]